MLRRVEQRSKLGLLKSRYQDIEKHFIKLSHFLQTQKQYGNQIFDTFAEIWKQLNESEVLIDQKLSQSSEDKKLTSALIALKKKLEEIKNALIELNNDQNCSSHHSILGSMLGKETKNIVINGDQQSQCKQEEHP